MVSSLFRHGSSRGFTLIELAVSLAIMGMMMIVLLYRYPDTTIRLSLANISHVTALLVREAQVRGSAIDSVESTIGGYGVYASLNDSENLVLFADIIDPDVPKTYGVSIGNGLYEDGTPNDNDNNNGQGNNQGCQDQGNPGNGNGNGGGGNQNCGGNNGAGNFIDETTIIKTFPRGYSIEKLCVLSSPQTVFSVNTCNTGHTPNINSLTISFTRPNPQPNIYINGDDVTNFSASCIELHSPRAPYGGHIRSVKVFKSGMIRMDTTGCY